ncbi:MAG: hypothetical protein KF819_01600 [Labilithrix sp.]|nr:hypothetical protein [Labilithrix sp.]
MKPRFRPRRVLVVALLAAPPLALFACDGPPREDVPRFYFPPDAPDEDALPDAPARPDAPLDAPVDVDAADADAGPVVARVIATGSGEQPDPGVGNGDHTCVISGATRSLYCWGANDHGQIGDGTTGLGTTASDVDSAKKIALDETGLAIDGFDEIALAGWHSCARKGSDLFCWGQRLSGAQAEPPALNADRTRPRAIGNFDVTRIGAGGPHGCALKSNGKIACFGHSTFNELGRPNADDVACTAPFFHDYNANATHVCSGTLVEVMFATPANVAELMLGEVHSCARAGGRVHCWGSNVSGELGRPGAGNAELNAQTVVTDPALLTALDNVIALAGDGGKHTCALRQGGAVFCWGKNDVGQLGTDPALIVQRGHAAAVPGIAGATAIGVAEGVSCAVRSDATVACWGADLAALGDGGVGQSFTPVAIKGPLGVGLLTDVAAVAPGVHHACALKKNGTVWCWGKNDRGQLGNGTKLDSAFPVQVVGL